MGNSGKDTERRNSSSIGIDTKSTREILGIINCEDQKVPLAVHDAIDEIANVVDMVTASLAAGGRLFYIGAGTSGRLGVLDASECPPTYGTDPCMITGIIAGGDKALRTSIEGAEDNREQGKKDIEEAGISGKDVLVGISANGDAPYVVGALEYARSIGAGCAMIASNHQAEAFKYVDPKYRITVVVGPEIITGSTRMKAGTAQKLVLNMITTTTMIKLGKVYDNYMVDMKPVNDKLVARAITMISEISGTGKEIAERFFTAAEGNVKLAIVMALTGLDNNKAQNLLDAHNGNIHFAVGDSSV